MTEISFPSSIGCGGVAGSAVTVYRSEHAPLPERESEPRELRLTLTLRQLSRVRPCPNGDAVPCKSSRLFQLPQRTFGARRRWTGSEC